tara:strand:- start:983 stop:1186 length:204 start_codon:yes stop_codon:yes gene_type:complete
VCSGTQLFCKFFYYKKAECKGTYTRLTYLPEAFNKIKPQPAATRRRAKLWQAVDVWLLTATQWKEAA